MEPKYKDGTTGAKELFSQKRLSELLADENVEEVRVFRLKKSMKVMVGTDDTGFREYKVIAVRPNGKVTMRPC